MSDSLQRLRHEVEALQDELQDRAEKFGEQVRQIHNRVCNAIRVERLLQPQESDTKDWSKDWSDETILKIVRNEPVDFEPHSAIRAFAREIARRRGLTP